MNAPGNLVDGARRDWSFLAASEGQLTTLKWIGVAAMLVDHIGRYGFGLGLDSWAFAVGRIAFPIFAAVLGIHLARFGIDAGRYVRTSRRLALWAVASMVPAWLARGEWLPVNVFATLALGALCCAASRHRPGVAGIAFLFVCFAAGLFVEFSTPGVALVWCVCAASKSPTSRLTQVGLLGSILLLTLMNGLFGGSAAVTGTLGGVSLVWIAGWLPGCGSRAKWVFYALYPLHLIGIGIAVQLVRT